jgi:hydrogenase maturation protein HypF
MSAAAIPLGGHFAGAAPVLAAGAWFKNALCGIKDGEARMSRVVGDLNTPEACIAHEEEAETLLAWLGTPAAIAHDLHPDFHSSRHAAGIAARLGVTAVPVQHHHAHIAAVCAEHGECGPVIGLALDGVGLGTDNTPWGGELLRVDGARFERLGHLAPLALPGGDRAAREPWRMAAAVLHDLGRGNEVAARYPDEPAVATVLAMLEKNLNCPRTSSAGRLFDAASGLLGLCLKMEMDAEAAIKLEQAATRRIESGGWPQAMAEGWRLDAACSTCARCWASSPASAMRSRAPPCSMRRWWRRWRNGLREPVRRRESKPWRLAGAVSSTVCWRRPASRIGSSWAARAGADQAGARRCGVGVGAGVGCVACLEI